MENLTPGMFSNTQTFPLSPVSNTITVSVCSQNCLKNTVSKIPTNAVYSNRSSQLDEKSNKSTPKSIILTLAARASSSTTTETPLLVSFSPSSYTSRSPSYVTSTSSSIYRPSITSSTFKPTTKTTTTTTTTTTTHKPALALSRDSDASDSKSYQVPPEIKFHPIPEDSYYDDDEYPLGKTRYEYEAHEDDSSNDPSDKKFITQKLLPVNPPASSSYGSSGIREDSPFSYDQPKHYFSYSFNKSPSSSTTSTTTTERTTTTSTTTTSTTTPKPVTQRQKIQSYIVTDVEPESFKPHRYLPSSSVAPVVSDYDGSYLNPSIRTRGQNTFLKALGTTLSATQQSTIATSTTFAPAFAYSSVAPVQVKPSAPAPFDSKKTVKLTLSTSLGGSRVSEPVGSTQSPRYFINQDQFDANNTFRLSLSTSLGHSTTTTTTRAPFSPSFPRYDGKLDQTSYRIIHSSPISSDPTTSTERPTAGPTRYEINPEDFESSKTIRLTLSTGLNGGSPTVSKGTVEAVEPSSHTPKYSQFTVSDAVTTTTTEPTTTTTTTQPTTKVPRYFPSSTFLPTRPRPYQGRVETVPFTRSNSRPTKVSFRDTDPTSSSEWVPSYPDKVFSSPQTNTLQEQDESEPDDALIPPKTEVAYEEQLEVRTPPPTRFPPRIPSPPTAAVDAKKIAEAVQTFTSRGLVFKEALNKTLEPTPASRVVVSPFKSLEVQRQTTSDKPFAYSTSRVISNIYRSTTESPRESPLKSYFLITAAPKLAAFSRSSTVNGISAFPEYTTEPTTSTTQSTTLSTTTTTEPTTTTTSTTPLTTSTTVTSTTFATSTEDTTTSTVRSTEVYRGRYRPVFNLARSSEASDEVTTPKYRLRNRGPPRRTYTRLRPTAHLANASLPFTNTESTVLSISSEYSDRRVSPSEAPSISSSTGSYLNRISTTERSHYDSEVSPVKASHYKSRFSDDSFKKTTVPSENVTLSTETKTTTTETEPVHVVQITDKPVYYTSYHLTSTELNPFGPSSNSKTESTTKKFRATVEMPEMNIPTEKELLSYQQEDSSSREEEDEEDEDDEDTHPEDLADYSYLETTNAASTSTTTPSTTTTTTTFKAPTTTAGRTSGPYKPHYRSSKRYTTSTTTTEPTSTTLSTSTPRYTSSTTQRLNLTTSTQAVPSTSQLPTSSTPAASYEEDETDDEDETDEQPFPSSNVTITSNTTPRLPTTTYSMNKLPPRASRVNNAIKTTIAAAQLPRRYSKPSAGKSIQCTENSLSAKCNEIPSRY